MSSRSSGVYRSRTRRRPRPRIARLAGLMSQIEETSRSLAPSAVRKRWDKIRGIEDEDDDEYENDKPGRAGARPYREKQGSAPLGVAS